MYRQTRFTIPSPYGDFTQEVEGPGYHEPYSTYLVIEPMTGRPVNAVPGSSWKSCMAFDLPAFTAWAKKYGIKTLKDSIFAPDPDDDMDDNQETAVAIAAAKPESHSVSHVNLPGPIANPFASSVPPRSPHNPFAASAERKAAPSNPFASPTSVSVAYDPLATPFNPFATSSASVTVSGNPFLTSSHSEASVKPVALVKSLKARRGQRAPRGRKRAIARTSSEASKTSSAATSSTSSTNSSSGHSD
ncbi:hypothetical protein F5Y18DRAFT_423428 [Xylariaceae sp. FL1019]|nr:hypothetical protein F5Y18DRAFT_423428 [Xylariaceae sp. FL1019]